MTIQQAFELALRHHQSGRLAEAEALYRQILAAEPRHAAALHLLGVIAYQAGRSEMAVDLIRQAIVIDPTYAEAWNNLGNAQKDTGQLDQAITSYRRAIALKPNYAEAHYNFANALRDKGHVDEAIASYRQAIILKPDFAEACNNLGNAFYDKGQLDSAIPAYLRAVGLKPHYAEAFCNLGNALKDTGKLDEAIIACRQAIALRPGYADAHSNLGNALKDAGDLDEAIAAYRRAIAIESTYAETHNNLGNALKDKGQPEEAIAAYREAIALKPAYAEAYSNLGNALKDTGRLDEAIAAYRQAIAIKPRLAEVHSNLLFILNYHPSLEALQIAGEQRRWNQEHGEPLRRFIQPHRNDRSVDRRLRIGYVSADFRDHVVGRNVLPFIGRHESSDFEVFCYAQVACADEVTERFRASAHHWRSSVGLTDEQLAAQIREDQIDILVDLTMHMAHNRLPVFARKPAPVQVTFAGYPGSTGLMAIDFRLSDPYLDPPGMEETIYSEQTVRLPHSFWCYNSLDSGDISANTLPANTNGFITFGCLNNFCKINDGVLRLWARVLQAVPASRLLLLAPQGSHRQHTLDVLGNQGVASERIEFVAPQPRRKYLELYHRIDLGLDTLPYSGHTTSLDSYWMGVPVVTLVGRTIVGRAGLSQLMNLGLPELIARTPEEYVRIAAGLAGDLPRLARLRSTLRGRMEASPLMDAPRFARDIEAAYREMWRKWCGEQNVPLR